MPRRPTFPRSTRNALADRLDDVAGDDMTDVRGTGDEPIPPFVVLNATRETCVDAEHRLHRVGSDVWYLSAETHESALARAEGAA